MRRDMAKVICERPRWFHPFGTTRGRPPRDPDDLPRCQGLRRAHDSYIGQKALNDYLAPLRRYLLKQVGRPWDAVWSEICRAPGSPTLNAHLRRHVEEYVATGRSEGRHLLFVDARTGLLRRREKRG